MISALIRRASSYDLDVIFRFICELQNRDFDKTNLRSIYNYNLQNPDHIYLVAEHNQQVIGFISCHIQKLLHHGGAVAEIQEMYVMVEYRSSGVGKELMETIKTKAKAKGAIQLEVTTRVIRKEAIKFYVREEFEDTHKKLVHYFKK
ncbi:MAG: GNAT family N-acetyltransferase [Cyclobacteriaceae bacterium]